MHDDMVMQKNNKQFLIWEKTPDITTDTTNKGSRPEIRATIGEKKSKVKLSNLVAACRPSRHH